MKRGLILFAALLLAGCSNTEVVNEDVETEVVASTATNEPDQNEVEQEADEPEVEPVVYTKEEVEALKLEMLTASEQASEYLSNTRSDIYMCGKLCDGQPLSDIQLSMDVSRTGLERSASALSDLVPRIRELATSNSEGIEPDEMTQVADQFEKSAGDIESFLVKQDWTSWDEPGELIQTMLDELENVSWLYKPYSPGISEDDGATLEAEANISSAIVEIRYARDELQTLYDGNVSGLREQPVEVGDGYGSVAAYYLDHSDQYIDLMLSSADLALGYPMDEPLEAELLTVKEKAGQLRQAILDYNELVRPYQEAEDYETVLARWNDINQVMNQIEDGLNLPTYQADIFLDFAN